ncbi:hypothetical protein HHI36_021373 [Cryptolaemus montrouzieri]|uniref:CRAL-TRIO domain-containing protein n=1 Tax=Cryptolaemus montrouzieri TaxID=559131 RepID=A0ABD2MWJ7_9CUCU
MSLEFEFSAAEVIQEGRVRRDDIEEIKIWAKSVHLSCLTDEQIVLFLLSCQNDLEKTQRTILAHYKAKYISPKISNGKNILSEDMSFVSTIVESCVIPRRTKDNNLVILQRLKNFSHWNFNLEKSMKYLFMTLDLGLMKNPPNGLITVFDMNGMGILHLTKLRLAALKLLFFFLQEGLPVQIKAIHVFNSAYFVDKLIAIIKPLMKSDLYDMLNFHPSSMDMEEFYEKYVEAECLPSDYGGKLPPMKTLEEKSLEDLKKMSKWFEVEEELRKDYKPPK